jgi:hypothetical protein
LTRGPLLILRLRAAKKLFKKRPIILNWGGRNNFAALLSRRSERLTNAIIPIG